MRNVSMLLAAAAVLVPTLASAQPALTAAATQPAEPAGYVQLDGVAGARIFDYDYSGAAIEGGHRLSDSWWAHATFAGGSAVQEPPLFGDGTETLDHGTFWAAAGGLEARGYLPGTNGIFGGYFGGDVGVRSYTMEMTQSTKAFAAVRNGLDVGGQHVRARAGLAVESDAVVELTAGLAYRW